MKITQEVRDYAANQKLSEADASQKGVEEKAMEFKKSGAQIYHNGIVMILNKNHPREVAQALPALLNRKEDTQS